jgi:hypothetical protein
MVDGNASLYDVPSHANMKAIRQAIPFAACAATPATSEKV